MTQVRTPPRPPHEKEKGRCSWCGGELTGRARSWCSNACVDFWFLVSDPKFQLRQLVAIHGRECWQCGTRQEYPERQLRYRMRDGTPYCTLIGPPAPQPVRLELEHVRPLWSLTPAERQEIRWWLPFNLQLLCRPCHKAKTRREAADRAALRRPTPGPPVEDPQLQLL